MEQCPRCEDVSQTEIVVTDTSVQQDFDVIHHSSQTDQESSAVLSDIFTLMKDAVNTFTCTQKATQEEIQKMASVLCQEAKQSNGLLQNILKELQDLRLTTSGRGLETFKPNWLDTKESSVNNLVRDPDKKFGIAHPLEKYYPGYHDVVIEDSPDTESSQVLATTAVNQAQSKNGETSSFTQSDNTIMSSKETNESDKAGIIINSLLSAQNIPPEIGIHDSYKRTEIAPSPFPISKSSVVVFGIKIKGCSETLHLHDALQRARAPDPFSSPRARFYDTILCLDISESMNDAGAFDEMVSVVNQFINGVEDAVGESGSEENIGVVTFGGRANVTQHLTNDFSRVRDAIERIEIGGKSPFFEAFIVALGALEGEGTVSLSGEYDIHPRIIFISDGHATSGQQEPSTRDWPVDPAKVRTHLVKLMSDFKTSDSSNMPHPIVFVPVGTKADRNLMSSLATLSGGMMVEPDNITSLCSYFKIQEAIGKTLVCLCSKKCKSAEIPAVARALVSNLHPSEEREVVSRVQEELQKPRKKKHSGKPTDFDDVHEDIEGVMSGDCLPLGTRVVRGPDWCWGAQDLCGPGTVIQHENKKHPFTWVMWDGGVCNRYPYGPDVGYHIWKTETSPRRRLFNNPLEIGMAVQKGPKLDSEDSIRNATKGVIIRRCSHRKRLKKTVFRIGLASAVRIGEIRALSEDPDSRCRFSGKDCSYLNCSTVLDNFAISGLRQCPLQALKAYLHRTTKVRWNNGVIMECKTDAVMYWDPLDEQANRRLLPFTSGISGPQLNQGEINVDVDEDDGNDESKVRAWQWRDDDGNWRLYPEDITERLEKEFNRRQDGTLAITRSGKNYRVKLKQMVETNTVSGSSREIKRVLLPWDEFLSLKTVEEMYHPPQF